MWGLLFTCVLLLFNKKKWCLTPFSIATRKNKHTLYNVISCIARNLLETRKNIKIESHPFYHIICDWCLRGWNKKNNLKSFQKQIPKWPTQKKWVFQNRQLSNFFVKISWIDHWVVRIDWCEGWATSMPFLQSILGHYGFFF